VKEFEKGKRYACKVIDLPAHTSDNMEDESKNDADAEKMKRENSYLKK
jgi:hypothetical protein